MNPASTWKEAIAALPSVESPEKLKSLMQILIEEFKAPVYATALKFSGGDDSLAADIFQETFLRIIRSRRHIRAPVAFPRFLKATAVNVALDLHRRRSSEKRGLERIREVAQDVDENALLETRLYVKAFLDRLEPREVEVLRSKFFLGERDAEASKRIGESPENIRVIRHRAMAKLRALIRDGEL